MDSIFVSFRCVKDFLLHHPEIISIIWKILYLCIQFTNHLTSVTSQLNQSMRSHSNHSKQVYQEVYAKNLATTVVTSEFRNFIMKEHRQFNNLLDKFIDKVSRLANDTDPDHKTNSLIIRLKYSTKLENPSLYET